MKYKIDYYLSVPENEADMKASSTMTQLIHNRFKSVFTGISCFKGTFSSQVKDGIKPY